MKKTIAGAVLLSGLATPAFAGETLSALWEEGKPILDTRLRYEYVDQQGLPEDAHATTFRARYGFETGALYGFTFLVEGETVIDLGLGRYNDTVNGRGNYPVVADPEDTELNRAQVSYQNGGVTATLGRQRIILGNGRFVGNVGWRQNEQTFDAFKLDFESIENLRVTYAYVDQVNRIFGDNSPNGRYNGETHLSEIAYAFSDALTAKAYGHFLSLDQAPLLSTRTIGLRLDGKTEAAGFSLKGVAEYAHQEDYDDNPLSLSLDYWHGEVKAGKDAWEVTLGGEVLEGNGTQGFSTPIATLHKFQGFADAFLTTPVNGIQDLYAGGSYTFGDLGPLSGIAFGATYHDFEAERGSASYGDELDFTLNAKLPHDLSLGLKAAFFDGENGFADRDKVWVQLAYSL
ncbi:hypothetical protein [Tepidicaulis sp.]|uniref:hypothetical protein n=1 Tax=Tepidicaulis sp. TaxID=1920809 RepID=UPI003B59AE02